MPRLFTRLIPLLLAALLSSCALSGDETNKIVLAAGPRGANLPIATVVTPSGTQSGTQVTIAFNILDLDTNDTANVTMQYSIDGGVTYKAMTKNASINSATTSLATSPASPGAQHSFVWDTTADIPASGGAKTNVVVKVTPADPVSGASGTPGVTNPFTVDNTQATGNVTLTSIFPNVGPVGGGTAVLVYGTGFTSANATTLTIGGRSAGSTASLISSTIISATTPAGSTTGAVSVVIGTGAQQATLSNAYTYTSNQSAAPAGSNVMTDVKGTKLPASGTVAAAQSYCGAWDDYDGDGDLDLFVAQMGLNLLFRNTGGTGGFAEIGATAGFNVSSDSRAAVWGDFDKDGDDDLFVANATSGQDELWIDGGTGFFTEVARTRGMTDNASGMCVALADYDRDNDLDIFVGNDAGADFLYKNGGTGFFTESAATAAVGGGAVATRGAAFGDTNGDGFLDLYVATNAAADKLYRGSSSGVFTDATATAGLSSANSNSRGCILVDFDNDGDLDILVCGTSNTNRLFQNGGTGLYTDVTGTGVGKKFPSSSGEDCAAGDYDNDGDLDVFVTNTGGTADVLYLNGGSGGSYVFTASTLIPAGTNNRDSAGAAFGDFDGNGTLDIFVATSNAAQENYLYSNAGSGGNWLKVFAFTDADGNSTDTTTSDDRVAYGAKVQVDTSDAGTFANDVTVTQIVDGGHGRGQDEPVHFGLGSKTSVDVKVTFVDGTQVTFFQIGANQTILVDDR